MIRKFSISLILVLAILLVSPGMAQASTLTYNLTYVFSGNTPASSSPYGTATFLDGANCLNAACAANTVQLVLTSSLESSDEFISEWYFNSSNLNISIGVTQTLAGTFTNPTFDLPGGTADQYKADGDGYYDFVVSFATAAAGRFNGTDSVLLTITGTGINVSTFNGVSNPKDGGTWPFHTAAHIQGIQGPQTCSGWVSDTGEGSSGSGSGPCGAVPENSSSLLLLSLGLAGFGIVAARKKFLLARNN